LGGRCPNTPDFPLNCVTTTSNNLIVVTILKAISKPTRKKYTNPSSPARPGEEGLFQIPLDRRVIVFKGRPLRWQDLFFVFIPATAAVFSPLGYGFWRAYYGYSQFGPTAAEAWSRPWFLLAAFSTLLLLLLALIRINIAHKFIVLRENGLHIHLSPLKDHTFTWSQISGISFEIKRVRFLGFTLQSKKNAKIYHNLGQPIQFGNEIQGLTYLVQEIKHRLYPRLWSALENDLHKGSWLFFGEIGLHREGLKIKKVRYPWEKVKRVSVKSGNVVVELTDNHRLNLAISRIPNIELLFQLIERGINL